MKHWRRPTGTEAEQLHAHLADALNTAGKRFGVSPGICMGLVMQMFADIDERGIEKLCGYIDLIMDNQIKAEIEAHTAR